MIGGARQVKTARPAAFLIGKGGGIPASPSGRTDIIGHEYTENTGYYQISIRFSPEGPGARSAKGSIYPKNSGKMHKTGKKERQHFIRTPYCIKSHVDIIYIHLLQIQNICLTEDSSDEQKGI